MAPASDQSIRAAGDAGVRKTLGLDAATSRRRRLLRLLLVLLALAAVAALIGWRATREGDKGPDYETAPVTRGDLEITVTATGSLDAMETVDVGAETSGRILAVHVDFNDPVKKGIRLAIGARGREVMWQFLVEAVVLSTLGGVIGMLVGLGGSFAATRALDMPFLILPDVIAVAFVFSALVGVCFGYLPARKAARLNPIDALRHE